MQRTPHFSCCAFIVKLDSLRQKDMTRGNGYESVDMRSCLVKFVDLSKVRFNYLHGRKLALFLQGLQFKRRCAQRVKVLLYYVAAGPRHCFMWFQWFLVMLQYDFHYKVDIEKKI